MFKNPRMRAIVPLRSLSKRIPQKNFVDIAGWPLYRFVLRKALDSGVFEQVILATDRLDLIESIDLSNPKVQCFKRSIITSSDTATSESVIEEVIEGLSISDSEIVCLIQATSPFLQIKYLHEMRDRFLQSSAVDSVFSAVRFKRFYVSEVVSEGFRRDRTQDIPGDLLETGLFWATRVQSFKNSGCRISGRYEIVIIEPEDDVDIDTLGELEANIPRLKAARGCYES